LEGKAATHKAEAEAMYTVKQRAVTQIHSDLLAREQGWVKAQEKAARQMDMRDADLRDLRGMITSVTERLEDVQMEQGTLRSDFSPRGAVGGGALAEARAELGAVKGRMDERLLELQSQLHKGTKELEAQWTAKWGAVQAGAATRERDLLRREESHKRGYEQRVERQEERLAVAVRDARVTGLEVREVEKRLFGEVATRWDRHEATEHVTKELRELERVLSARQEQWHQQLEDKHDARRAEWLDRETHVSVHRGEVEKSAEERILAKCLRQLNKQGELNATRLRRDRETELQELDRRGERVGREIALSESVVEQSRRELQEERAFFRIVIETKVTPQFPQNFPDLTQMNTKSPLPPLLLLLPS
jgi:hypothetical protein